MGLDHGVPLQSVLHRLYIGSTMREAEHSILRYKRKGVIETTRIQSERRYSNNWVEEQ